MTQPVIPTLPTAPSRGSAPSTFATQADAWVAALPAFGVKLNEMGTYVTAEATAASASELAAAASEAVALAAANYKGAWSSLVGALNKPASVSHSNKFWMLINNLANVTTSTPSGSNPDWLEIKAGQATVRVTATSLTAASGDHVAVTAIGQTITLPASPAAGDEVAVSVGNFTNTIIGRNSQPIMTMAENMTMDFPNSSVTLRYVDATRGWVIL